MYRTINPLSFGIIFWERFFQCKEEELRETKDLMRKDRQTSQRKSSGFNPSKEESNAEKSYSLVNLLPYDLQSSINYLGFMIFLSASDYPSKFRKLNKNVSNVHFSREEMLFK